MLVGFSYFQVEASVEWLMKFIILLWLTMLSALYMSRAIILKDRAVFQYLEHFAWGGNFALLWLGRLTWRLLSTRSAVIMMWCCSINLIRSGLLWVCLEIHFSFVDESLSQDRVASIAQSKSLVTKSCAPLNPNEKHHKIPLNANKWKQLTTKKGRNILIIFICLLPKSSSSSRFLPTYPILN